MIIIQNNKNKSTHEEIINNIKNSNDVRIKLFIERYPMLFDMVTKKEGFDYSSFEYFLTMRDKIIKKELTSDDASKHVGQVWFDKYYKK
jgi:hypothetical protein